MKKAIKIFVGIVLVAAVITGIIYITGWSAFSVGRIIGILIALWLLGSIPSIIKKLKHRGNEHGI